MSLDGKILARAKERLDSRRRENEEAQLRRRQLAYSKNPKIRDIDERIRTTAIDAIGLAMSKGEDALQALEQVRDLNLSLQEERALELAACGLPGDYLNDRYICPKCRDTGYDGTKLCSCLMELYAQEQRRELSGLLKLGQETFDSFNLELYDDKPDPETGISPRRYMEQVFEYCLQYARKFSAASPNLFLWGGTGLGKTFLSTCIARVVSENGFSVVYETASALFSQFEAEKFARSDTSDSGEDVERALGCDLLILDDLGTEMTTVFVTSALYTLVNTRLAAGKQTIISTNLTQADLAGRYSPQIASRIQGEYQTLRFYGRDIRLLKKTGKP